MTHFCEIIGPKYFLGDRIESIRISLRHMVFEDALTILSYASPYEVQLEVESGASGASSRPSTLLRNNKRAGNSPTERICHPFYRSQSISDLLKVSLSAPHTTFIHTPKYIPDSLRFIFRCRGSSLSLLS